MIKQFYKDKKYMMVDIEAIYDESTSKLLSKNNKFDRCYAIHKTDGFDYSELDISTIPAEDIAASKLHTWLKLNNKITDISSYVEKIVDRMSEIADDFDINGYDLTDADEYDSSLENFADGFIRQTIRECTTDQDTETMLKEWTNTGSGQFLNQLWQRKHLNIMPMQPIQN